MLILVWFGSMLNVPVNSFSVMLGRRHRFLGITSTIWEGGVNMSCSRTQHGEPSGARENVEWRFSTFVQYLLPTREIEIK